MGKVWVRAGISRVDRDILKIISDRRRLGRTTVDRDILGTRWLCVMFDLGGALRIS